MIGRSENADFGPDLRTCLPRCHTLLNISVNEPAYSFSFGLVRSICFGDGFDRNERFTSTL